MDQQLLHDLEDCAERLMKERLLEAQIVLAITGIIKREHKTRVEEIENGIMKDLENYYVEKLKRNS